MIEWDEELVAQRERFFHDCLDQDCQAGQRAIRMGRAEHQAANDLRAQLAQRDAELAAALLDVERMRDTQKDMGSLDDAVAAILRRYPDDPYVDYLTSRLEDSVKPRATELAALRALARDVIDSQDAAMRHPVTEAKVRESMNAMAALRAVISDDQEGQ